MAILVDQRNDDRLKVTGFYKFSANLDKLGKADYARRMLKAAEPHLIRALDAQMLRHPGELQKSLQSTGPQKYKNGGFYLAYRATTGNEKPGHKPNQEKMIYLINREYIRAGRLPDGRIIEREYVIPADDVITHAVWASEKAVEDAMQAEFDRIIQEAWNG